MALALGSQGTALLASEVSGKKLQSQGKKLQSQGLSSFCAGSDSSALAFSGALICGEKRLVLSAALPSVSDGHNGGTTASLERIPKQFREGNLKDGLEQNFASFPKSSYGLNLTQMDMFMTEDSPMKTQSESVTEVRTTRRRVRAFASKDSADNGQTKVEDVPVPGWAKPDSDELPPWAKDEKSSSSQEQAREDLPFPVYLIGSTVVAIAAVGSVFEYFNRHAIFGVIQPDSAFYTPILGFFAITGLPTSGFLFYKSIQLANKASEAADKEDGVRR